MTERVFFDLETHLIRPDAPWPVPVACGWTIVGSQDAPGILTRDAIVPWFAAVVREGATLVAHNASFDASVLATLPGLLPIIWHLYSEGRILCTAHGCALADLRMTGELAKRGYQLDSCVERFAPDHAVPDKSDPWRLRWAELDGLPKSAWPAEAVRYLAADVTSGAAVARVVCDETDLARQSAIDFACARIGAYGFVTDAEAVRRKCDALEEEALRLRAACPDFFHVKGTKKDPKQVKNMDAVRAYAEGAGVTERTDTGLISVTEDSLDGIDDPRLAAFAKSLQVEAAAGRLGALLDPMGHGMPTAAVRCRYKMATSGRRIAGGYKRRAGEPGRGQVLPGTGNVQNIPTGVGAKGGPHNQGWREVVVPRAGRTFGVCDFTGLELSTVAEVATNIVGWSRLADALRAKRDPHAIMGARLAKTSEAAMMAALAGQLGPEAKPYAKRFRQTAKAPNFGLPGGLGCQTFVAFAWSNYRLRLTLDEAAEIRAEWREAWPEFPEGYFPNASKMCDLGEPVVSQGSGRIRGTGAYTEICNTPFQALGADIALDALFLVQWACEVLRPSAPELFGSHVVFFGHDEILTEHPTSTAAEAVERQAEIMRDCGREWLAHVPLGTDPILCAVWSKLAEPKHDKAGRLVPWEPK